MNLIALNVRKGLSIKSCARSRQFTATCELIVILLLLKKVSK